MFFAQVPCTTIMFTWRIIGTTSLLISITNVVFLSFNRRRCLLLLLFFTSGILSYFALSLGLSGSGIFPFPLIEVSEVLFLLLLRGIRCSAGVTLDTLYTCPDIPERLELYFLISISLGFSILVLLSDKMSDEIDLDLSTDFTVSYVLVL